ncbi:MAG: hypothetical protein IPK82_05500 [Polyangiaceae bacterium]|nr:hypothetical protein [Polyangiaceae bacterium]
MHQWLKHIAYSIAAVAFSASFAAFTACENTAGNCELTAECTGAPGVTEGACDPNIADDTIPSTCGVFASPNAGAPGDGSPQSPFTSLADAIEAASKTSARRVYACAGTFSENITVPGDFIVYGGLNCNGTWLAQQDGRTTIAPQSGIPITALPGSGNATHIENVAAIAPPGAAPDGTSTNPLAGGSSIAMVALEEANVELLRCDLTAGDGAMGITVDPDSAPNAAPNGNSGEDACSTSGLGGMGGATQCEVSTKGGNGGKGGEPGAINGEPGIAGDPTASAGTPGSGQTDVDNCTPGGDGPAGETGKQGSGAPETNILLDSEWKGVAGEDGKPGREGGGGGGGGGGKICSGAQRGAGGGGGGAGGCAGAGGKGGGAGGSSIGLWAVGAAVSLNQTIIVAKGGGAGGAGGKGQIGAMGGNGGNPGAASGDSIACKGGNGGKGGDGGPGGGGQGGSSIAIVGDMNAPKVIDSTAQFAMNGVGGNGGDGASAAAKGADGRACAGFDIAAGECFSALP